MPPKIISRGRGRKLKASAVADSLALEQSEAEQLKRTRQNPPGSHEDSSRTSLNDGDPLVQIPLEQMALFQKFVAAQNNNQNSSTSSQSQRFPVNTPVSSSFTRTTTSSAVETESPYEDVEKSIDGIEGDYLELAGPEGGGHSPNMTSSSIAERSSTSSGSNMLQSCRGATKNSKKKKNNNAQNSVCLNLGATSKLSDRDIGVDEKWAEKLKNGPHYSGILILSSSFYSFNNSLGVTLRGPRMSCYVKYFTGDIEGIYFPNDEIEYLSMVVYFWHAQELTAKKLSGANIMVGQKWNYNFLITDFINKCFLEFK